MIEDGEMKLVLHRKVTSKCYRCGKKELRKSAKSWSYMSTCKKCHLHVACVKEILLENWEKKHPHAGKFKCKVETENSLALESKDSKLQIVVQNKERKPGKLTKFMKMLKVAITLIMAAVVGDPTALVATLIASLINN
ncbi:putative DC1 [Cocos nucifera]|uniref:Putative DC1 n=1 Tax=Cocos nucifera TaxID=13894 RepID=A0A8K0I4M1_COCNU|nr:putative DC1 [Cocos nucifera]